MTAPITQFNRDSHARVSAEIQRALANLGRDLGLTISVGGGKLESDGMVVKVHLRTTNQSLVEDKARERFALLASRYGMVPEDYGAEVTVGRDRFRLIGFNPNAPKYCYEGERISDGKRFRLGRSIDAQVAAGRPARIAAENRRRAAEAEPEQPQHASMF